MGLIGMGLIVIGACLKGSSAKKMFGITKYNPTNYYLQTSLMILTVRKFLKRDLATPRGGLSNCSAMPHATGTRL
jgi:hypothetical protein